MFILWVRVANETRFRQCIQDQKNYLININYGTHVVLINDKKRRT